MLAGLAGGVLMKPTCATALRYLFFSNKKSKSDLGQCPMPLPTRQEVLTVPGETFNFFAVGDWGATPLGYTLSGPNSCDCGNGQKCHASVYEHTSAFGRHGSEGEACQKDHGHPRHTDAQQSVADSMALLAQEQDPVVVINVGDNFYLGGVAGPWIDTNARAFGFSQVSAEQAFTDTWSKVYMENTHDPNKKLHVPWLSVMGNHDYGGEGCLADWQAQIEWTHKDPSKSWSMPWQYHKRRIKTDGYFIDIFMTEANIDDAADGGNSVCAQAVCPGDFGPQAKGDHDKCQARYHAWNDAGLDWLDKQMDISRREGARWQIVSGHYSDEVAGEERFKRMSTPGSGISSLYIGGHTHMQRIKTDHGPVVVVTGAGGGYDLDDSSHGWGFTSVKISKDRIDVTLMRSLGLGTIGRPDTTQCIPHPTAKSACGGEASDLTV